MSSIDDAFTEKVRAALAAVADPETAGLLELASLADSVSRRSYVASLGDSKWVVRGPRNGAAGVLDMRREIIVAEEAAQLGVAPAVVAADAGEGLLITEYRHAAKPLTPEGARLPENIQRIAAQLKRLHESRRDVRGFDPQGFAAEYLAAIGGQAALDARQRKLGAEFEVLAREYAARYPRIVLCHNDLFSSNVIDDGRLWLIDFEYAVNAAPVLDLAGLAAMNDFGRYERLQLAESYYQHTALPFSMTELDKVIRLVRLMAYFWGLASARAAADPTPFDGVSERMAAALA